MTFYLAGDKIGIKKNWNEKADDGESTGKVQDKRIGDGVSPVPVLPGNGPRR